MVVTTKAVQNKIFNEDQNKVKRAWVTPDIEMISAGDIQGGQIRLLFETSTFVGAQGNQS